MAQPPEDGSTTPPEAPREPIAADDATIPWTPPEPAPIDPGSIVEPVVEPPSPLISWTPSGGASQMPPPLALPGEAGVMPSDTASVPADAAPLVGWELPVAFTQPPTVDGYAIASTWSRLVAYFIDALLIGIIPAVLSLATTDYAALMREVVDASRAGGTAVVAVPATLATVLITVVTAGLNFIYFVGFWTGDGRATLGMRGLRMQVVDAVSGRTLSLGAAIRRWVALGAPLSLLAIVPALQSTAGIAGLLLAVVLLITVATDARRQGLHDKWAGSTVIRSTASGAGATAVGCLVLILLVGGVGIVVAVLAAGEVLPQMEPFLREMQALR